MITELFFAGLKDKMVENYVNASKNFTKITTLDASNDAAYFELANINYRQNKFLEAEIAIKNAISINPKNIWYLKLQADIYKRNGNMDALIIVFDQLITMSTEEPSLYFDKANALLIAGKDEEAQKIYSAIEQKFGTSKELKEKNIAYKVGTFPFRALGRARASGDIDGMAKVLADATTDEILGVHIIGARAADMIAEAVVAMEFRASAEDIGRISHAHPTYTEALKEAALAATANRSLHS